MKGIAKQVYDSSLKDKEFLKDVYEADGDKKPGIFSDEVGKVLFATIYYGYLVGKYGNNWKAYINH